MTKLRISGIAVWTLAALSCAAVANPVQPTPIPATPKSRLGLRPASPERAWHLQGGLDQRYDDNILFFSAGTIQRFKSSSSSQLFRIQSVDDLVSSPWVELRAALGRSELGMGARFNFYKGNPVRNYEMFNMYLDPPRSTGSALRFNYRWLHDGYAGELTDPDSGVLGAVFYDVHELEVRYRRRVSSIVTIMPRQSLRMRLNNSRLNDPRTRAGTDTNLLVCVRATPSLRLDFEADVEYLQALSPRYDFDPSALRYFVEMGALIEPRGVRIGLSPSIRFGRRQYTTSRPDDSTFRGRTDSLYQLQLTTLYRFSTMVSMRATYTHDGVSAGISNAQDEDTSFVRNVCSAGLTLKY